MTILQLSDEVKDKLFAEFTERLDGLKEHADRLYVTSKIPEFEWPAGKEPAELQAFFNRMLERTEKTLTLLCPKDQRDGVKAEVLPKRDAWKNAYQYTAHCLSLTLPATSVEGGKRVGSVFTAALDIVNPNRTSCVETNAEGTPVNTYIDALAALVHLSALDEEKSRLIAKQASNAWKYMESVRTGGNCMNF